MGKKQFFLGGNHFLVARGKKRFLGGNHFWGGVKKKKIFLGGRGIFFRGE